MIDPNLIDPSAPGPTLGPTATVDLAVDDMSAGGDLTLPDDPDLLLPGEGDGILSPEEEQAGEGYGDPYDV